MAKKTAKQKSGAPRVRVRMYRQGLGDCFLVTFDVGGTERHMLIDCGTLGATTTKVKLAEVVADIRATTGDHLDVLVATHEHLDHVSGFRSLREEFEKIDIDHVWLAWTENPGDDLARKIVKAKNDLGAALMQAGRALRAAPAFARAKADAEAVESLLGFFDEDALGAGKFAPTVDEAMDFVRTGTGGKTCYFNPGDGPIEKDWLPGFRIFVLGPPRSEAAINRMGEHGSSELYSLANALRGAAMVFASGKPAAEALEPDSPDEAEFAANLPFDVRFRYEASSDDTKRMFRKTYFAEGQEWRRIDADWLHIAPDLALQLDHATNNTSLVLAIERIADGKVLLLPADAQEGNWVSWHDASMKWNVTGGPGAGTVTVADLLARTVFYKVGHHSSHNATAKGSGLELMTSAKELTAFIPVDRAVALGRNPKDSWKMPAVALYRRLLEKCNGRVMRSDIGWADDAANAADPQVEDAFVGLATATEWTKWRAAQAAAKQVKPPTRLFVDYVLE
jgi:glyoxylase-like metal-dependent hydrolase (beta-lactamase superfamily II)